MFSTEHIQNEVITITSEQPSSEYHCERNFQSEMYPYDKSYEEQEEDLIYFKWKQQMNYSMFSSDNNKNEVLTLTSGHTYS